MDKVLITGGSGFLGLWLTKALIESGFTVRIADIRHNKELAIKIVGASAAQYIEWFKTDVTSTEQLDKAVYGCQQIVHLAGILTPECRANPVLATQINFQSLVNIFVLARKYQITSVYYTSSAGVFGPTQGDFPDPKTFYGSLKLACEYLARCFYYDVDQYQPISSVGFRPLLVYGAGRGKGGASAGPSLACEHAIQKKPYTLPLTGNTGFIYVEDLAQVIVKTIKAKPQGAQAVNLPGIIANITDFTKLLCEKTQFHDISVAGNTLGIKMHANKLSSYKWLNDIEYTDIATGIDKTLNFYRSGYNKFA